MTATPAPTPARVKDEAELTAKNVALIDSFTKANGRTCGRCTMCCDIVGVGELKKPPDTKCKALRARQGLRDLRSPSEYLSGLELSLAHQQEFRRRMVPGEVPHRRLHYQRRRRVESGAHVRG